VPARAPDEYENTVAEETILAGQYQVIRKLGEGGMGEVYLAKDLLLNDRLVAVKVLPALRVASKRAMRQLRQEAAAMAELTHENIVRFFHFGEHVSLPFMVMQYIEGQTLDDLLGEKGRLSAEETIQLCTPLAQALDYAHSKGVVHRDVKPSNIFIDTAGKPYLADFGIARIAKDTITQVTGRDTTAGTLQYMSPEQCRGEWDLTAASDVYSFATVLYECLSGSVPFRTGPIRDLIINEAPPRLGVDHPVISPIMQGLAKESVDRPSSCTALLELRKREGRVLIGVPSAARSVPEAGYSVVSDGTSPAARQFTNSLGMEFLLVEPRDLAPDGFLIGSSQGEIGRHEDEVQHRVVLSKPYWLGATPVTQMQYQEVMGCNPSTFSDAGSAKGDRENLQGDPGDHPVEGVSWHDAVEFLERLSRLENRRYRLPTEAEWEFACRAGSTTPFCTGHSIATSRANCRAGLAPGGIGQKEGGHGTTPVRMYFPNSWGLCDMHGNVSEWCVDFYGDYPDSDTLNPRGPQTGTHRVLRGGNWDSEPHDCRSARRHRCLPEFKGSVIGFRACLDPE